MIAAWMLYVVAVTLLLFLGAAAAEYVARALRVSTRWVWVATMFSALVLAMRAYDSNVQNDIVATSISVRRTTVSANADSLYASNPHATSATLRKNSISNGIDQLFVSAGNFVRVVEQAALRLNVRALERWNHALIAGWLFSSLLMLACIAASVLKLKRIEHQLVPAVIDNHSVLMSTDIGPAVFGVLRTRIALPAWVFALPASARRLILEHERAHASAFDPALMYLAALIVALQPWNLALWAVFARFRLALETDCDRRVLRTATRAETLQYGELLIAVYERTRPAPIPFVALIKRPSNLERRIRHITTRPKVISLSVGMAVLSAFGLVTTAWAAATPNRSSIVSTADTRLNQSTAQSNASNSRARPVVAPKELASPNDVAPTKHDTTKALSVSAVSHVDTSTANPALPEVEASSALSNADLKIKQRHPCNLFGPVEADARPDRFGRLPKSRVTWWPNGCSIYGDVVVMALDSTRLLFAARDTADTGISAFIIFETARPSVPASLAWSTPAGNAELTDSVLVFSNPMSAAQSVVVSTRAGGQLRQPIEALRLNSSNMLVSQMRGVPWEKVAQLPKAARCVPSEQEAPSASPELPGPLSKWKDAQPLKRVCFVVNDQRFEFPIP